MFLRVQHEFLESQRLFLLYLVLDIGVHEHKGRL